MWFHKNGDRILFYSILFYSLLWFYAAEKEQKEWNKQVSGAWTPNDHCIQREQKANGSKQKGAESQTHITLSLVWGYAHANQCALFTDISLTDEHLMTTLIIWLQTICQACMCV